MSEQRAEIEAAIDAHPDDVRAYEVYADHLQEHGDPRGELIALAIAAETDRGITAAERAFLDANQNVLLPPAWLARIRDLWSTLGGSTWRWGCFQRVHVGAACEDVFDELLVHPAGRFVVELAIEHGIDMQRAIDSLAAAPRPTLRRLTLGAPPRAGPIDADLAQLWRNLPRLQQLAIVGGGARLGELALPDLLELRIDPIAVDDLLVLQRAELPWLDRLELGGCEMTDGLAAIIDGTRLPELRELALTGSRDTARILENLGRSPLVRRLARLSLRNGDLRDAAVPLVVRYADAFAKLALDLNFNRLTYAGQRALANMTNVEAQFQHQPWG